MRWRSLHSVTWYSMGRDEQEPSDLSVDMVIQIMLSLCIKEEDGQWWTVTSRGGFSDWRWWMVSWRRCHLSWEINDAKEQSWQARPSRIGYSAQPCWKGKQDQSRWGRQVRSLDSGCSAKDAQQQSWKVKTGGKLGNAQKFSGDGALIWTAVVMLEWWKMI